MFGPSILWYAIHALGNLFKDVPNIYLVLEVVGGHELFLYHRRVDHDLFFLIHAVVYVELFYIHTHEMGDYVRDCTIYMYFYCGHIYRGGADFSGIVH